MSKLIHKREFSFSQARNKKKKGGEYIPGEEKKMFNRR